MKIQELIALISERPGMYIGEQTISRFECFLLGWMFASKDPEAEEIMMEFTKHVADRYRIRSSHSWASIIRFYAQDDVSALTDALDQLKEYFESLEENSDTPS